MGRTALLVGPNNAGKSTLIGALRAADLMLRHAHAKTPSGYFVDRGVRVRGFPISPRHYEVEHERLRFNSNHDETRVEIGFSEGRALRLVWPADEQGGFFYLYESEKPQPRNTSEARTRFPLFGVIPPMVPAEAREPVLEAKTVREAAHTRRASRHFRNQMRLLSQTDGAAPGRTAFDDFQAFANQWLPEITLDAPSEVLDDDGAYIVLPYWEGLGWRELSWAGDGIQVFLQFLFHCFRLRHSPAIVIDEPDVYLHADLQRRLWGVLEEREGQTILATHSGEIGGAATARKTIWVDRNRNRGLALNDDAEAERLTRILGFQFNTRIARALRARTAIFVEGGDSSLITPIARLVGATSVAREVDTAVIAINGSDNWRRLEGFSWLRSELVAADSGVWLILDRDFKTAAYVEMIEERLSNAGVSVHVWSRHELENYCLVPDAIASASGAPSDWVRSAIDRATDGMKEDVLLQMAKARLQEPKELHHDPAKLLDNARLERDTWWNDPDVRVRLCPGKEIFALLNIDLSEAGFTTISPESVVRQMNSADVDIEMNSVLRKVAGI